jgi:Monooxygenase subunit B protein
MIDRFAQQLTPNRSVIFLWGNLFEDEDSISIQSYAELRQANHDSDLTFNWQRNNQDYGFSAGLPINRVVFPPRKVPRSVVQQLSAAYDDLAIIHDEPDFSSRTKPLKAVSDLEKALSFFVDQVQGAWMHLISYNGKSVGWVNAGDVNRAWPIRKYLPELDLIEGVVGYLFLQDDREHNPASQEQTTAYLRNAIRQFIEATPDDEIGAPALALAKAIQGIVEFDQSKKHDVTPELRKTFEEVVKLVPFSSQARNLKAIVDLKACCTVKSDDHRAQEVISQLMDAVRVEPEDDTSLRNLQNLYLALGSPNAGQVSAVREALKAQEKPISIADAADKPKKSQEAFLRMQALNWYDLKLSKTTGQVNEDYEITGKLHIMNTWPAAIHSDHAFLKVDQSEAVVNRQFTPGSIELKVGKTYEFTMAFRARRPGHWCVSAQLSIANGDQVSSPCKYIDIKDNFADFKDPIDRLNGSTIDLEPFGITSIYMWHLLWFVAGAAWLWYWFTRRGLLGRSMWVASKKEDEVITPQERLVGAITLCCSLSS